MILFSKNTAIIESAINNIQDDSDDFQKLK